MNIAPPRLVKNLQAMQVEVTVNKKCKQLSCTTQHSNDACRTTVQ